MTDITLVQDFGTDNQSFISFGTDGDLDSVDIKSGIALVYFKGAGGGNNGYVVGRTPSASVNGLRFFLNHNSGSPRITFGKDSASAGNPQRSGDNGGVAYSGWYYVAFTHDGTLNQTGIKLFEAPQASSLVEVPTYATGGNGTTSLDANAGDTFYLGNRAGLDRGVNAKIAYVALYSDTKSLSDLQSIQTNGPLSNTTNMLLCWANGQDYGPLAKTATSTGTSVTNDTVTLPTNLALGDGGTTTVESSFGFTSSATASIEIAASVASSFGFTSSASADVGVTGATASSSFGFTSNSSATLTIDATTSNSFGFTSSAVGEQPATGITLHDDFGAHSFNPALSSVSGSGDSAIVSIKPQVQESEVVSSQTRWLKPRLKVTGVNGIRPTFRFLDYKSGDGGSHYYTYDSTKRIMFSYDYETWYYFDTTTPNSGSQYVEFRHNTVFTQDTVYIAYSRSVQPEQAAQWIEDWATAHPTKFVPSSVATSYTPSGDVSSWPAQAFIANEFAAQTDSLGDAVPKVPYYQAVIDDSAYTNQKRWALFTWMAHAGEDQALYAMRAAINFLLSNDSAAVNLRKYYKILISGPTNGPGWYGGGWRGSFTQGTGNIDDANRHFSDGSPGLEIVTLPRTAILSVLSGQKVVFGIDFHGSFSDDFWIYSTTDTADTEFVNAHNSFGGQAVTLSGSGEGTGFTSYWMRNTLGAKHSFTYEYGDPAPVTDTQMTESGENIVKAFNKLSDDGNLGVLGGVSSSFGFTSSATAQQPNDDAVVSSSFGFTSSATVEMTLAATTSSSFGFTSASLAEQTINASVTSAFGFTSASSASLSVDASVSSSFGFSGQSQATLTIEGQTSSGFGFTSSALGGPTLTGAVVSSAFGFTSNAVADIQAPDIEASVSSSFGFTSQSFAFPKINAQAASSFGFTSSALGDVETIEAVVTSSFGFTSAAVVEMGVSAVTSSGFGFTSQVQARQPVIANVQSGFGFTSSAVVILGGTITLPDVSSGRIYEYPVVSRVYEKR